MPISQVNNEEMLRLMASRFRKIGDPIFAWGDIHSFVMNMPGLIGYWPGAVDIGTPRILDASGDGVHLTRQGEAKISIDETSPMTAYINLDGTNDYFNHVDDERFDIPGNDDFIAPEDRGLTFAAWVYLDTLPSAGNSRYIMSRRGDGELPDFEQGYSMRVDDDNRLYFETFGTYNESMDVGYGTLSAWHFIAGVFYKGSNFISIYLDDGGGETDIDPDALIGLPNVPFALGAKNDATNFWDGRIAHPLLCACALPAELLNTYYQMTSTLIRGVI